MQDSYRCSTKAGSQSTNCAANCLQSDLNKFFGNQISTQNYNLLAIKSNQFKPKTHSTNCAANYLQSSLISEGCFFRGQSNYVN